MSLHDGSPTVTTDKTDLDWKDEAPMTDFSGLNAVVTGGASGIGAATALEMRRRGARVAIIDRAAGELDADFVSVTADITNDHDVARAIAEIVRQLGGIDVLINNAGVGAVGSVDVNSDEEWHRVFDVNVVGAARVVRHSLPWLLTSSAASIVNTASVAGLIGLHDRALYSATKGALIALTYAMAADHLKSGIRVNAVAPGTADTPWVQRLLSEADDPAATETSLRARQPIGRLVAAEEVAFAIANLASPRAASTTGIVFAVDGGLASIR